MGQPFQTILKNIDIVEMFIYIFSKKSLFVVYMK